MNKTLKTSCTKPHRWLATGALCLGLATSALAQPQSKTINDGWRFLKGECTAAADSAFDDARWEPVNLPHTWNTDSYTVKNYYQGPAWYRRTMSIPQEWSGKQILLHLEGVSKAATVYVNGHHAGEHAGGYTACTLDLTPYLHFGAANSLAIRADNGRKDIAPLSADFTFFGGIYRDVWLTALPAQHFNRLNMGSDGLFISTPQVSREEATVAIRGEVTNSSADKSTVEVTTTIYAPDGQPVQTLSRSLRLKAGETLAFQLQIAGYGFEELKQTRLLLETAQIPLLIRRITPEMLEQLNGIIDRMESAETEEADRLDLNFHLKLMEATGNRIQKIFGQVLILMFDRKYRGKFLNPAAVRKSVGDHRAMLKALSEGSETKLTELIRQHIQPL